MAFKKGARALLQMMMANPSPVLGLAQLEMRVRMKMMVVLSFKMMVMMGSGGGSENCNDDITKGTSTTTVLSLTCCHEGPLCKR